MCKLSAKLKYNALTLQPRSKEDREKFWAFRCQDISERMIYVQLVIFVAWISKYIATVIDNPAYHHVGQTISMLLMIIVAAVAVIIKRRAKQDFVYLLLIFMAIF